MLLLTLRKEFFAVKRQVPPQITKVFLHLFLCKSVWITLIK